MKHLLLLLLTCLPLCAATTYPMLSDTTNRTVTGGVTNLSFLNSNSVFTGTARWMGIVTLTNTGNIFVGDGAGLTGVGVATSGGLATNLTATGLTVATGQTNTHLTASSVVVTDANKGIVSGTTTANLATLSANQTFTGTNTFPAAGLFKPNFISRRLLFITNNVFISSVVTNAVDQTNNGGYANGSAVLIATMPPLLASNSVVLVGYQIIRTNSNTGTAFIEIYCGNETNWTGSSTVALTSIGKSLQTGLVVVKNANSMTNQVLLPGIALNQHIVPTNSFDSTASWSVYISAQTATSFTNLWFETIWFEEVVIP